MIWRKDMPEDSVPVLCAIKRNEYLEYQVLLPVSNRTFVRDYSGKFISDGKVHFYRQKSHAVSGVGDNYGAVLVLGNDYDNIIAWAEIEGLE